MAERRVWLVDNYDSFTFNLAQALRVLGADVVVHRNDQVAVQEGLDLQPTHIVISPGPGRPDDAGISMAVIEAALKRDIPLLGVCLGHQALGQVLGGTVDRAPRLMHGKSSPVFHDGEGVFRDLGNPLEAARYHSLIVLAGDLPGALVRTAYTEEGEIMGVRHRDKPVVGVQFHPESVLTPEGDHLLANFLGVPWTA